MANSFSTSNAGRGDKTPRGRGARDVDSQFDPWHWLRQGVGALASLKLTVVLFALSIGLILIGTLAQDYLPLWEVLHSVFRTWFSWVDFRVFVPTSFFPDVDQDNIRGGFYYPGGKTIGLLMLINLLSAHAIRFKLQAKGMRLWSGLGVIAVGCVVTWIVIQSGFSQNEIHQASVKWETLWQVFKWCMAALWALVLYGTFYCYVKLPRRRIIERCLLTVASTVIGGLLGYVVVLGDAAQLEDPSMRILWQLTKGLVAGGVLWAGCWLVFRKRAGVVLLHGGVALLMISEVVVATMVDETQMTIEEGTAQNYGMDIRKVEFAVIDKQTYKDKEEDFVVAIPESRLKSNDLIEHDDLPFDVQLLEYHENSRLKERPANKPDESTSGGGARYEIVSVPPSAGADKDSSVDSPSAYVRLRDKDGGETIGNYLVSRELLPQKVVVDGRSFEIVLRYKHVYKPYIVRLHDVRRHNYLGTSTPWDYSSYIKLVDAEGEVVHKNYRIWMNNPLRFNNDTFYQSGHYQDPATGREYTTLQIVSNTSWMIPYVSCMIVLAGMLAHFSTVLMRFLRRAAPIGAEVVGDIGDASANTPAAPSSRRHKALDGGADNRRGESVPRDPIAEQPEWLFQLGRFLPLLVVVAAAVWVGGKLRSPRMDEDAAQIYEFGKLPVVFEGRVKPFDTLARTSLRVISNKQTYIDGNGVRQPAIRWLLDVIARPNAADQEKVFKVESLEVLDALNLEPRKGFYYSYDELLPRKSKPSQVKRYRSDVATAAEKEEAKHHLSLYERKLLELSRRVARYEVLRQSFTTQPFRPASERMRREKPDEWEAELARRHDGLVQALDQISAQPPLAVFEPELTEQVGQAQWLPQTTALLMAYRDQLFQREAFDANPATEHLTGILTAYADGNVADFNQHVSQYRQYVEKHAPLIDEKSNGVVELTPMNAAKLDFEAWFNHFEPFYLAMVLYVAAFVLAALAWLGWTRPLNRASFWLIVFTLVLHTLALIFRIYISGRPPVTNLVSTGMLIGWGCVVLGLVAEAIYRLGVGNIVAAVGGGASLLVTHLLTTMVADHRGDSMAVMQAVLDTQFWLATHVICVTLGYATTFVAGLLGIILIVRGVATPSLSQDNCRTLARMIYGTTCFAIFFSFIGTVLGGLWADDSWGRFWGWDPKENGALIIVIWNALILHARWDGMIKERGLAVLAVVGNIVTTWSWFGVNELGIGLHAYGFADGVLFALSMFVISQLIVIAAGCLPKDLWWSFQRHRLDRQRGRAGG